MESEPRGGTSVFSNVARGIPALLVLVVLALGYFLYQQMTSNPTSPSPDIATQDNTAESFDFPPLTNDEYVALNPSSQNIFEQPTAVQKIATVAETLAIGAECRVSPVALKTQNGARLELKNYDSVAHTITVQTGTSNTYSYPVPAYGSTAMTVDFGKTGGSYSIYNISCEKSSSAIGMLMIIE